MIVVAVLIVTFITACALSFFDEEKNRTMIIAYVVMTFIMVLTAGLKPISIDNDSNAYVNYFYYANDDTVELSFVMIASILRNIADEPQLLFIVYAILSIPFKAYALTKISDLWFLGMAVWLSRYMILQDMTQIRVAVSTAIFLYSLLYLGNGDKRKYLLCCVGATFFHYSAIVMFPLALVGNKDLTKRWLIALYVLPIMGYMLSSLNINFLNLIPIPYIQDKVEIYEAARDDGFMGMDEINLFNPMYLLRLALYYLLLWKYEIVKEHCAILPILLKIFAFSYVAYTMLSFIPVFAYRISEFYGITELVLMPLVIYTVKPEWVARCFLIAVFAYITYLDIFKNELLSLKF